MHAPPGYNRLIVGHLPAIRGVQSHCETLIGTDKPSPKAPSVAILDELTESKAEDSYNYTNNTVSVLNLAGPLLYI